MLFADANIESPIRHLFHHIFQRASTRHGRCDANNFFIFFCKLNNRMPKNILVFWRLRDFILFLEYLPGYLIKQTGCMPLGLVLFCQVISLTLNCFYVENFWPGNIA